MYIASIHQPLQPSAAPSLTRAQELCDDLGRAWRAVKCSYLALALTSLVLEDHWSLWLCNWVACEPVCTGGLPLSFQVLRSGPVGWTPFVRIKRLGAHETWVAWSAGMSWCSLRWTLPGGMMCRRMSRNILYSKATRSWTSWLRCSVAFNAKIPKTQDCFDCFDCLATQRLSAIMLDRSLEIGILLTSRPRGPRGPCRACGGPCGAFYVEGRRDLWDIAAWYWRPCLSRKMPCELCWQPWP